MAGPAPISLEDARAMVLSEVRPLASELVPLEDALGRVLAEDARAAAPVPAFDNSAMDGYAVRAGDTAGAAGDAPVLLDLVGESRAGAPAAIGLEAGQALRISTGAALPEGADAVLRQEDAAEPEGGGVHVLAAVPPGRDVRRAGDDIQAGAEVVRCGTVLGPPELGVLAAVNLAAVECARRPLVRVITTGDELALPGAPMPAGGVRNSNAFTVAAQARRAGAEVGVVAGVRDDPAATRQAIEEALGVDLLVICGGVSVGPHDHVKPALDALGVEQRFWRVALRPGGPAWFGVEESGGRRTLVLGLPGNPVSAMVVFHLLARPALCALQRADPAPRRVSAILDEDVGGSSGRVHAVRCRLAMADDGWRVRLTGAQGSHVLTSMLEADGLALIAPEGVRAGERVEVELLA